MRVDKDGQRIFMLEDDDLAFGDVPIVVTQRIVDEAEHGVSVALRAGLELPLGSESNGFGNGGIDWGVGLLAETSENRLTLTGGAYYVLVSTPDSFEGTDVEIGDQVQLHGGLEVRWNDDASIVLGLRWNTPTTRDIRIKEVDSSVLDLDLGWVQDLGCGSQLLFGFTEDLVAESGPDLTVFAGWRGGF